MKKFSVPVAATAALIPLFFIVSFIETSHITTPLHFSQNYVVKNTVNRLPTIHKPAPIILKNARMTSDTVLQINTNKAIDRAAVKSEKQSRFFISTDKNPAYIMSKNVNILARSSTGAMDPYSGKVDHVHENILCPDVGVGVGYKITKHVTVNAAYDGAFLTMADAGHYNKNMNAGGVGLSIRF